MTILATHPDDGTAPAPGQPVVLVIDEQALLALDLWEQAELTTLLAGQLSQTGRLVSRVRRSAVHALHARGVQPSHIAQRLGVTAGRISQLLAVGRPSKSTAAVSKVVA